ncbi:hypothetical protein MTO96_027083 [Rhipicephalus appendiculatus]
MLMGMEMATIFVSQPKKPPPAAMSRSLRGDDPLHGERGHRGAASAAAVRGDEALSADSRQTPWRPALAAQHQQHPPTVTMVTLKDGDKTVACFVDHGVSPSLTAIATRRRLSPVPVLGVSDFVINTRIHMSFTGSRG